MPDDPKAYEEGARMALALAEWCEELADRYDDEWRKACHRDAARHRERAAWYLERRAILETKVDYA